MNFAKKIGAGLCVGLLAAAVSLGAWHTGMLQRLEWKAWDGWVSLLARPAASSAKIKFIFLDQYSLDWMANNMGVSWPWPREMYAPIVEFCRRSGAESVVFDVLYTEPSAWGVEDDERLGAAIGQPPPFIGAMFLGSGEAGETSWPEWAPKPGAALTKGAVPVWIEQCRQPKATFPIPEVATNATTIGNVQANPDADGIYRRAKPFQVFDDIPVPALGVAPFLASGTGAKPEFGAETAVIGKTRVPVDRRGNLILRFRGPIDNYETYNAAAVIQSEINLQSGEQPPIANANVFRGCHVFFGFSAPGLYDLKATPVGKDGAYPAVGIQATLLDNLMQGDFLRDAPNTLLLALVMALALACGAAVCACRSARQTLIVFIIALPVPAALSLGAYEHGLWLPFVPVESAAALALVGAVLVNYATEGRQKRFIRNAFKQYLNGDVIEELVKHPERLKLGGEQRELTIFFSDLQGFSGISERLTPEQLTSLLNEYLTAMTDIIQGLGGTIDKFEGDAIIAFWNAPLAQPDHAQRCVRAALECQAKLEGMNPAFKTRIGTELFMRIGVNTGQVVVGNMGSDSRFNYTILGDAANLASRLEGINKQFGTYTLVSETAMRAMNGAFPAREISRVTVVGRKTPVTVYEPMPRDCFEKRKELLSQFARALAIFYKGDFKAAAEAFEPLAASDPPSAAYVRKCREMFDNPPDMWDGVWRITEK